MSVIAALLAALASAVGASQPAALPSALPTGRAELTADLDVAQQIIDDPASSSPDIASAGRFEQLATLTLARHRRRRSVPPSAAWRRRSPA